MKSGYLKMRITGFVLSVLPLLFLCGFKPDDPPIVKKVTITRISDPIKIDGKLDEPIWNTIAGIGDFINHWPIDTGLAKLQTEVKLAYDDSYIYIAAKCYTAAPPILQTLKRDMNTWSNDGFYIVLDPVNQHISGYLFGVNAGGAQTDGIIEINDLTTDWDTKWFAEVAPNEGYYIVEMAIPYQALRFPPGGKQWGINFIRSDMHNNLYSTWAYIPLQLNGYNLNYNPNMEWAEAPKVSQGKNVIQPYAISTVNRTYTAGNFQSNNVKPNFGADAKLALSSFLNLDLTTNPDFSQIDVDQQIINLGYTDILLPERRTFFLENNDLFSNFGVGPVKPFVSRKIGLTTDGRPKTIFGGGRLTGNLNNQLRIGVMDVQTNRFESENQQNYFVGVFEQKLLKRSNIKGVFTDRLGFNKQGGISSKDFNRLAGLEFNYNSENNLTHAAAKFHYTFNNFGNDKGQLFLLNYVYSGRIWATNFWYIDAGDHFNPEMGFSPYNVYFDADANKIQRKGYRQLWNTTTRYFYPKNGFINTISLAAETYGNLFSDGTLWEARNQITGSIDFKNTSNFRLFANHFVTRLPFPSKLAGQRVNPGRYRFGVYHTEYKTDNRKNISLNMLAEAGDYYGGYRYTYGGGITLRKQPLLNIDLGTNINNIQLNNKNIDLLLLNSKVELNFSKNLFWTTFLQYNTQAKTFNANSRFQWRFRPMSDLYLVYTDNYETDIFQPKNRAVSLKLNYWLNL